jgi:hypothetical protein
LPAVVHAWNDLLTRAKEAAQSWNKKEEMAQIATRHDEFRKRLNQSQVEQWAINKSIHYNEWISLRKEDFLPVVSAFQELISSFRCQQCGAFFYVTPPRGQKEAVRCDCGTVNFNLKKRS